PCAASGLSTARSPSRCSARDGLAAEPPAIFSDKSANFDLSWRPGTTSRRRQERLVPKRTDPPDCIGRNAMPTTKLTRRRVLASTAAVTAALATPYVRGAHAAGKLSVGFWDHWVPGANNASKTLCEEWAAKEKVDLSI